jgi:ubiquitin carboxyl-terminal hydrolase 14
MSNTGAGHYVGWCAASQDPSTGEVQYDADPDKQEWYKFDDDKVSTVSREKILALEGGGTSSLSLSLSFLP